jgi:hypothetical protein
MSTAQTPAAVAEALTLPAETTPAPGGETPALAAEKKPAAPAFPPPALPAPSAQQTPASGGEAPAPGLSHAQMQIVKSSVAFITKYTVFGSDDNKNPKKILNPDEVVGSSSLRVRPPHPEWEVLAFE